VRQHPGRNHFAQRVLSDFQEALQMDANSGEPWSELDIADLTHSLAYGNTIADAASLLRRVFADAPIARPKE
jgi:hypothetical protein